MFTDVSDKITTISTDIPTVIPPADTPQSPAEMRRTALYLTLSQVPEGCVVSYGELAHLAGLGRAARWVGRTLSQLPQDTRLPWHRVLAAGGRISLPVGSASGDEQRARLRSEGVTILNNRVDIQRHGWRPVEHSG
nr:MGMT family protein [Pseudomonas carnis]